MKRKRTNASERGLLKSTSGITSSTDVKSAKRPSASNVPANGSADSSAGKTISAAPTASPLSTPTDSPSSSPLLTRKLRPKKLPEKFAQVVLDFLMRRAAEFKVRYDDYTRAMRNLDGPDLVVAEQQRLYLKHALSAIESMIPRVFKHDKLYRVPPSETAE